MGACGSSVDDAFAVLNKAPSNYAKLASLLQRDSADLLAVKSQGFRCASYSLLIRAIQRQDARAVQGRALCSRM
jgi:hypothetical protein